MKITIGIPTCNRYHCLDNLLLSIILQTKLPDEILIIDDSPFSQDVRNIDHYSYILHLLDEKKIKWKYLFGKKVGQHVSHEFVQQNAMGDLILRLDDDCVLEKDVVEKLYNVISKNSKIGAVAPLVLTPKASYLPENAENNIENIYAPNIQWYKWRRNGRKEVDHLYSCYMYRKGIAKYDLNLSPKGFREETLHSHSIKRSGYKLLVDSNSVIYHFKSRNGGIRSDQSRDKEMFEHDEKIFNGYLNLWNVKNGNKICILDCGIGDHYAFKTLIYRLKEKYPKLTLAVCFPEIFFDEEVELISIQDAKNLFGNVEGFSIYHKMTEWNWNKSLIEAFEKLYLS